MDGILTKTVHTATRESNQDKDVVIEINEKTLPISKIRITRDEIILVTKDSE
jgi:hypothetical protein